MFTNPIHQHLLLRSRVAFHILSPTLCAALSNGQLSAIAALWPLKAAKGQTGRHGPRGTSGDDAWRWGAAGSAYRRRVPSCLMSSYGFISFLCGSAILQIHAFKNGVLPIFLPLYPAWPPGSSAPAHGRRSPFPFVFSVRIVSEKIHLFIPIIHGNI